MHVRLGVLDPGTVGRQGGFRLLEAGFIVRRVDDGQNLTLLDDTVEVGIQFLDTTGNLAADLDGDNCFERAGRGDLPLDISLTNGGGQEFICRGLIGSSRDESRDQNHGGDDDPNSCKCDVAIPSHSDSLWWDSAASVNRLVSGCRVNHIANAAFRQTVTFAVDDRVDC